MKIEILIYNKEKKIFENDSIEYKWISLKNENILDEIKANYYLYKKMINKYYKDNNIPYKKYLYDDRYEEQFNSLIEKINK
jgi:hypothetical protein